jgi:hypothetical protein
VKRKTHDSAVPVVHGLSLGKHEWIVIAEDDERAPCTVFRRTIGQCSVSWYLAVNNLEINKRLV